MCMTHVICDPKVKVSETYEIMFKLMFNEIKVLQKTWKINTY